VLLVYPVYWAGKEKGRRAGQVLVGSAVALCMGKSRLCSAHIMCTAHRVRKHLGVL
jgi:hypothetical protein